MKVHYLGPKGTFSEEAAAWFADNASKITDIVPQKSITDAISAIDDNALAAVPYYNLIDGVITETLDKITSAQFRVYAAVRIPIRIAAGGASKLADNASVFSHPKALAQCSNYLDEHHPEKQRIAVASTAEGVERAINEGGLALATERTLVNGGAQILERDAANNYMERPNYTEFLLLGGTDKQISLTLPKAKETRSIIVCQPLDDRPGLIAGVSGYINYLQLNITRMHVRPARKAVTVTFDPQTFIFEIQNGVSDDERERVLQALSLGLAPGITSEAAILGPYPLYEAD